MTIARALLLVGLGALAACNSSASSSAAGSPAPSAAPVATGPVEGRLVEVAVGDSGFSPASIPAKKGETLTLRFVRTTKSDCLKAIEFPDTGVKKDLPMNTPVDVVVKADKEGTIAFSCWMKMVFGKIVVAAS